MMESWAEAKVAIAKFMSPLFAWIALGWAIYPYAAKYLSDAEDPTAQMDIARMQLFGMVAAVTCLAISLDCAAYYFSRKKPEWRPQTQGGSAECPFCGADVNLGAKDCPQCARRLG